MLMLDSLFKVHKSSKMLSWSLVLLLAGLVIAEFDGEIQKKYEELPFSEFVTYFNSLNLTWSITDYSEQHNFALGALKGRSGNKYPVEVHEGITDLPDNFDSRTKWPHCDSIRTINDQGDCGSCWVFGSVDTASDRTCIHKNINVLLSEAEGTCINDGSVCGGGDSDEGFQFWLTKGLVTKQCANYTVKKANGDCNTTCENPQMKYNDDKHFGEKVYTVESKSIKEELFQNGPVQGNMEVMEDFLQYKGGIYDYKYGAFKGLHSVRIIGYGTEGGVDFLLVANSWGTTWGEEGYFRIKPHMMMLYEGVLTGLPKN